MDLKAFLQYLFDGAFAVFQDLVHLFSNADLKTLRLVFKSLSDELLPYLFRRVYISAHEADLDVFQAIAGHDRIRQKVNEIMWDDTTFDRWIGGFQTYKDRLLQVVPLPSHSKLDMPTLIAAYRFWAAEATTFAENREEKVDVQVLEANWRRFPALQHITVISRSRLTYVDPRGYWDVWQTPRSRSWKRQPFYHYLLHPEPFKPAIAATVVQSEGIRPMGTLIGLASASSSPTSTPPPPPSQLPTSLQITSLEITSIGGGQTRASASGGRAGNRYERTWLVDLPSLTASRPMVVRRRLSRGGVPASSPAANPNPNPNPNPSLTLHLLLETPASELFAQPRLWETKVASILRTSADSLTSLTLNSVSIDHFWAFVSSFWTMMSPSQSHSSLLHHGRHLRRLTLIDCWASDPTPLLVWLGTSHLPPLNHHIPTFNSSYTLATKTTTTGEEPTDQLRKMEVLIRGLDIQDTNWTQILHSLKAAGAQFEVFDVKGSRCAGEVRLSGCWHSARESVAPWNADSDEVTRWLGAAQNTDPAGGLPLWRGPG